MSSMELKLKAHTCDGGDTITAFLPPLVEFDVVVAWPGGSLRHEMNIDSYDDEVRLIVKLSQASVLADALSRLAHDLRTEAKRLWQAKGDAEP